MSQGIASLHKILKDETRQKILTLLIINERLSYTELMEQIDVLTGILNYHLKILGELIEKDENGKYMLTEKGKLASKLLVEFPEDNPIQRRKRQKKFWTATALIEAIEVITVITLYNYNLIDSRILTIFVVGCVGSVFIAYLGYKLQGEKRPEAGSKEEQARMRVVYVLGGGLIGGLIAFFGPPLVAIISLFSGGPNTLRLIESYYFYEFIVFLVVSIILGSIIGYYVGKRNCFQQPKWGKWLEEHIPTPA